MREAVTISERRARALVGLARTTLRRVIQEAPATVTLKQRIAQLAHERRRFGYRRIQDLLRREGVHANHKRVYRLYREAGLAVRKRRRRKLVMLDGRSERPRTLRVGLTLGDFLAVEMRHLLQEMHVVKQG